ncbi:MAG TPA: hypothetical protein VNS32_10170 [Flavisolibacter sp.]|nr:hypothetical protein [Flavisolibacter sp.]
MKRSLSTLTITGLLVLHLITTEGCYHYRIQTTNPDPATSYQKKVVWSYCWGLINKPQNFVVPNCNNNNALDEVLVTTNFGYSILTIVTLGIVCPLEMKWKCHKPPQRVGNMQP